MRLIRIKSRNRKPSRLNQGGRVDGLIRMANQTTVGGMDCWKGNKD